MSLRSTLGADRDPITKISDLGDIAPNTSQSCARVEVMAAIGTALGVKDGHEGLGASDKRVQPEPASSIVNVLRENHNLILRRDLQA